MKDKFGQSGGWSATGLMLNDGKSKAAHLQVNFLATEGRPNPSKNYTVQFSVGPTKTLAGKLLQAPVFPEAEIIWSVEGNSVRRVVSVVNGMSITGVGEAVSVRVYDNTPQAFAGGGFTYQVDITVAPGSRASTQQPPTLSYNTSLGLALTDTFPEQTIDIPQNAGIINYFLQWEAYVQATSQPIALTSADLAVIELASAFNVKRYSVVDLKGNWIPLAPGATQLKFKAFLPGGTPTPWEIEIFPTFGIDG